MKVVSAVIGANYGDEGKGLMTDFLSRRESLVIRFNGGAQAGHTVVAPDGRRHVFHHFGSGALQGAMTLLSEPFLVNPLVFNTEWHELYQKFRFFPSAIIDPRCRVSTPWDMLLNQEKEKQRGNGRHGSCGLGIHETVVRSKTHMLCAADLMKPREELKKQLIELREGYFRERLRELDLVGPEFFSDQRLLDRYLMDCDFLAGHCRMTAWGPDLAAQFNHIVFEGAQGLRLDEDSQDFPHVTCSKTGLHNIIGLMQEGRFDNQVLNVFYCTRHYVTRHGAGPLNHELPAKREWLMRNDATNVTNEWQGQIRYGVFDVEDFLWPIRKDLKETNGITVSPQLALTCIDQEENGTVQFYEKGSLTGTHYTGLMEVLMSRLKMEDAYYSNGPTRNGVRRYGS